jgi:hypothetical protein
MNLLIIAVTIIFRIITVAPPTITSRVTIDRPYLAAYIDKGGGGTVTTMAPLASSITTPILITTTVILMAAIIITTMWFIIASINTPVITTPIILARLVTSPIIASRLITAPVIVIMACVAWRD